MEELNQCQKILDYSDFNYSTILGSVYVTLLEVYATYISLHVPVYCTYMYYYYIYALLLYIAVTYTVKKRIIYTLLEIINIPVRQPTKVKPYLVDAASKLERDLGISVGDSNIRIFLICLKLKS